MRNIKLENIKTVNFRLNNFCVPTKKTRTNRHVIGAYENKGFVATIRNLRGSYTVKRFGLAMSDQTNVALGPMPEIDGTDIKRMFCFSTHQSGEVVNTLLTVTHNGVYFTPLFGSMPTLPIPQSEFKDFECFAYSYSNGQDLLFASNAKGLFAADRSLWFNPLPMDFSVRQLQVFDNRLFVLDTDQQTVHFSAPLDMSDFSHETGLAGSFKTDDDLGAILSLEVYDGRLLIVHEFGLRTLTTAYDSTKFRLQILTHSYQPIINGSVKALGDTIYFLTHGGLCRYNRRVELIDIEINIDSTDARSIIFDSKYFLSYGDKMYIVEKFLDNITIFEDMPISAFEVIWNSFDSTLAVLVADDATFIYQITLGIHDPQAAEVEQAVATLNSGGTLDDITWGQIDLLCTHGLAQHFFNLGDEKKVILANGEEVIMQIVGFNHDLLSGGSGIATITFGTKNLIARTLPMNRIAAHLVNWSASDIRTQILPDEFRLLPEDLQRVIKTVNKQSVDSVIFNNLENTVDKLWLFSVAELTGSLVLNRTLEGQKYAYHAIHGWGDNPLTANPQRIVNLNHQPHEYWTRTSSYRNGGVFVFINHLGTPGFQPAIRDSGIRYGFCIGNQTKFLSNLSININPKQKGHRAYSKIQQSWESDWFFLGYATTKQYVRRVLVHTVGDIELVVMNTTRERRINVSGSDVIQTINLNLKGEAFKVKVISRTSNTDISSLSVTVGW